MNIDLVKSSLIVSLLFGFSATAVCAEEDAAKDASIAEKPSDAVVVTEEASVTPEVKKKSWLNAGFDFRAREVHFDNIPIILDPPGITRSGMNHFFRFRTRLWAQADIGEMASVHTRFIHEVRHIARPDSNTAWEWPEEIIVDSLYLDLHALDDWKIRVGRQDFAGPVTGYGTGKLILDGTPKDGSRTIYFDAVKIRYTGIENMSVDLVGIYNEAENELAIDSEERDLTGYTKGFNDMTESGAFVYLKDSRFENTPYEAYYIYKRESSWDSSGTPKSGGNFNTFGFRVMPKLGECFSGNLEAAYQLGNRGDQDQEAFMVDSAINYNVPAIEKVPVTLSLGLYYISGDDPDSDDDEGWNPLWARWPQYSELYIYAFDAEGAGRWSNVIFPHLDLSVKLSDNVKVKAYVGQLLSDEKDGPGGGDERGWLGVVRTDFTIAKGKAGTLKGHLLAEVLNPGDYYMVDDTAHFLRWELIYSF